MRENFKLRKMKVGLVSVAITMLYIMTYGEAEASETSDAIGNHNVNKTEESKTASQLVQNNKEINADQTKRILSNWILSSQEIKKSQVLHYQIN
ncbi:putative surface protein [Staphylococcus aureus]|uniref:Putative surface protein n=1 Tax=Staphylococcus aureus TaxID=1280 RepID=A0A380DM04_STAAU|nr:putative surface protein [Staphylococcus aureus]